jgi:hypothetical protein
MTPAAKAVYLGLLIGLALRSLDSGKRALFSVRFTTRSDLWRLQRLLISQTCSIGTLTRNMRSPPCR